MLELKVALKMKYSVLFLVTNLPSPRKKCEQGMWYQWMPMGHPTVVIVLWLLYPVKPWPQ